MSDLGPNEIKESIEATGYFAAFFGALGAIFMWIFKRQINRLDVIEKEYVPNDRHEKAIDKLESGMRDIEKTFRDKHQITHDKIDSNQKEIMAFLINDVKRDKSDG